MKKYLVGFLLLCSCASQKSLNKQELTSNNLTADGKLFTSLFQQSAAEYKALCYQAYNIAKLRLDMHLANNTSTKPLAIVTDIDETVLDNSPYAVHRALTGLDYTDSSWTDWTARAMADTLSGALGFFKYAASKNVEIFYVTNRLESERAVTLQNLKNFGFPNTEDKNLFLKDGTSSKEARRNQIAATHDIILYLGDNLSDFSTLFDHKNLTERTQNTNTLASEFGNKFIVFPNGNYGDWESALYQYNYNLSPAQKDSLIKTVLKNY